MIDFYLMEDVYCKIYLYILVLIFKVDDVVVIVFGLFFLKCFWLRYIFIVNISILYIMCKNDII